MKTLGDFLSRTSWTPDHTAHSARLERMSNRVGETREETRWPGKHKHVFIWWTDGEYAVAFNENPSRGWSWPLIKMEKTS